MTLDFESGVEAEIEVILRESPLTVEAETVLALDDLQKMLTALVSNASKSDSNKLFFMFNKLMLMAQERFWNYDHPYAEE